MFQNLDRVSASTCIKIGRRILPLLEGDSRLGGPAATLRSVQEPLEAKHIAHQTAVDAARLARARRRDCKLTLGDSIRGFALFLLTLTRNNFEALLFRRYFRTNYGDALLLHAAELAAYAEGLQAKLAEETDPGILAFREPIATCRGDLIVSEAEFNECAETEVAAFLLVEAEKLDWICGLTASRLQATEILYRDRSTIRRLYHAAAPRVASAASAEPEPPVVLEDSTTPTRPEASDEGTSEPSTEQT